MLGALLALSGVAGAATFEPTRHDDPTPGSCKPKDCSLREAINAANASPGAKVVLGKGTYNLEIPPTDPDTGTADDGDLNVDQGMKILGKGPQKTKIDAHGIDRVFMIIQSSGHVLLRGLTIKGGDAYQHPTQTATLGGGIWAYAFDTVKLVNVAVRDNTADFGGGIRDQTPTVVLKKTTIAKNAANEGGGIHIPIGLFDPSVLQVTSSTIQGNQAAKGGGILADGYSASPDDDEPDIRLTNSTVAGNQTLNEAAGLFADNGALMTLDNTTVAYNQANTDDTGSAVAGGIYQHSGSTFAVGDSIIASNTVGQGGSDADCSGTFTGSGNVLGAATGCSTLPAGPNQFVGSALIGGLTDHGGPTKTIALKAASPALGYAKTCPARDQRGVKRPKHNCDSGSYERKGN